MNSKVVGTILLILAGIFVTYFLVFIVFNRANGGMLQLWDGKALWPASEKKTPVELDTATVISDKIQIKNCVADPKVINVKLNSSISMENTDEVAHTIIINNNQSYAIPAGERENIFVNFSDMLGKITFTCDTKPSGTLIVLPKS